MQMDTPVDAALRQNTLDSRAKALDTLERTSRPSILALLVPVWLALAFAILVAFLPSPKPPFVAGMLAMAIALIAVSMIRAQRRLDALVNLVVQDLRIQ
jgi:hypothetical protein